MNKTNDSVIIVIKTLNNISGYYIPIFFCFSVLVNSLSMYVCFYTKLRYSSSSIYLGVLAISDIGVLITIFVDWLELRNIIYVNYLDELLTGSEKLFDFLSVWIIVVFTVQRYMAIKRPLLCRLDTVKRAKNVVLGLADLAVLYSIPWFIMIAMYINIHTYDEERKLDYWWWIFDTINAIITFVLPTTITAIFNARIVHNIREHNRIQRNLILSFVASNKKTKSSENETSYIEDTKMLVIISSTIICLNIPFQISRQLVALEILEISNKHFYIIWIVTQLLWLANYGINFFLNCATGKNFRKEMIRIFTKRSDIRRNEDIEMEKY
ncbi:probable G-protein coupled receptor 139 [Linepithema humile]|uniref:probable G-protein coupled receptor 139 n=1 Tax=Linepithema humile TaxID=83485 RepID=UPI00351DAC58